ncbi:MAG: hypothetical protein KY433_05545, partial [Actinobacteria bacterium]|nr:hypothetical protein [Actinomycetota bacterium]
TDTGVPLQRVFHPIAVHFKGKGLYKTDYGTRNRARENAETTASESTSDDGKKSDSPPPGDGSTAVQKPETAKADAKRPSPGSADSK